MSNKYNTVVDFADFLKENGHQLFEKDSKLCMQFEQICILQEFLLRISVNSKQNKHINGNELLDNKEFLLLFKSNRLHLIQDFLFKITNLKIIGDLEKIEKLKGIGSLKLCIFGSLTYLEIKSCPINIICNLQNLRNQLEVLQCVKSVNKLQDVLHLCGGDQSLPLIWSKLHTLGLSNNNLKCLDTSLRLATSIQILDLSHNSIKDCGQNLHYLIKLKKLNLSFNKLESIPSLCQENSKSSLEHLDISYNSIETIQVENAKKLSSVTFLNLNYNLINDLEQLKHLQMLSSLNKVIRQKRAKALFCPSLFIHNLTLATRNF
jgi:hypothetical protein